ncbi:MAG TPA: helix-turn-helix domain-containing protein, partial [Candidatus Paceibacterota bacterium]|nr:helix-turn-helix domain-containing protein [Candidatus Paceibacterota bacterium]
ITVQEIGLRTGVKRPTIYHALHTLSEKGLVMEHEGSGKSAFRMEAPARLLGWIEQQKDAFVQKEDAVQALIAQLASRAPASGSGMEIAQYADAKNANAVIDLAFYPRSKECVIAAPSASFIPSMEESIERAQERGVKVRAIFKKHLAATLLIYDDTIVFVPDPSSATVITSAPLASLLSALL